MRHEAQRLRRIIGNMENGETRRILANRACSVDYVQEVGKGLSLYVEAELDSGWWSVKRFGPWTKPGDAERYRLLG